jgi:hypothetical protein
MVRHEAGQGDADHTVKAQVKYTAATGEREGK